MSTELEVLTQGSHTLSWSFFYIQEGTLESAKGGNLDHQQCLGRFFGILGGDPRQLLIFRSFIFPFFFFSFFMVISQTQPVHL